MTALLRVEPRASCVLDNYSTSDYIPSPIIQIFKNLYWQLQTYSCDILSVYMYSDNSYFGSLMVPLGFSMLAVGSSSPPTILGLWCWWGTSYFKENQGIFSIGYLTNRPPRSKIFLGVSHWGRERIKLHASQKKRFPQICQPHFLLHWQMHIPWLFTLDTEIKKCFWKGES